MNAASAPFAVVLARIATTTGVLRVRTNDTGRSEHNGGSLCELHGRVAALITQMRQVADELEETIA